MIEEGAGVFAYSRGKTQTDAFPRNGSATTFDDFERIVLKDRARSKGQTYYAAPFRINGDGRAHRCAEGAQPRAWLPFDLDGFRDADAFVEIRLWLMRYRGFGYTTASSTPEAPRARLILEASRSINREEGRRACEAIEAAIRQDLGADVAKFDASVYRAEQPIYAPLVNAQTYRFEGEPVDVDELLARAPLAPPPRTTSAGLAAVASQSDPILRALAAKNMVRRELAPGRYAVTCPCAADHTSETSESATQYALPHFGGFSFGNFTCLHAHCRERPQGEFIQALELDPRHVRREQANADRHTAAGSPALRPIDLLRPMAAPPLRSSDVPRVLASFAEAQARATGFDVSIMLAAGIGAACAALSDDVRLCVSSRSEWFESGRLWITIVGGPGAGKTPGSKASMGPIFAMHREGIEAWARENKDVEEKPQMPLLYVSDATTEALADNLSGNTRGLLYFVDEFESWLAAHDAYRSGAGKDRGEWLRLYDGGPHQVNRVKRGAFFVKNWGVSLLSATTPAVLRKLAPKLPDDGLLQRILFVLATPASLPDESLLRVESRQPTEAWDRALRRLRAIPPGVTRLSPEARDVFETERNELHTLTQAFEDQHASFASHLAKRGAMLARLALVFHALDAIDVSVDVGADTMSTAARFLRRQERHAQALYGSLLGADTGMALARDIARSILAAELVEFNRRDLTGHCRAIRGADEQTRHAALTLLCDCGWIAPCSPMQGHGARWAVDPRVHDLFADYGTAARERRDLVRSRLSENHDA